MSLIVNAAPVSSKFANVQINDAAAGISAGFAEMHYKGKVWAVKYRGATKVVERADGDGPSNSIEVVIVAASDYKSKKFYAQYNEGESKRPDCSSINGLTPQRDVPFKQADNCLICPKNQPGSKVDENGVARGRACRDLKRLAIVPLPDLENELWGGPMLLPVPPASLNDYAMFIRQLQSQGYPYCAVGVKISFDPAHAYPKFVFSGIRVLNDDEADIVLRLRDDPRTKRVLDGDESVEAGAQSGVAPPQLGAPSAKFAGMTGAQTAPEAAPAPLSQQAMAKAPPAAPKPAPKAQPKQMAPVEETPPFDTEDASTGTSLDDELDALLN